MEFALKITRREFCERAGALVLAGAALGTLSPLFAQPAWAQTVSAAELATAGPLGDMTMGADTAPVTIVEYASMTCSHCANFAEKTFPELKKRYIDTGKVRYILREFPLDPLSAAGFMLARCAGKDDKGKFFTMVDTLFAKQKEWAFVQRPLPALQTIAKQAGFTDQSFEQCIGDQKMLDGIRAVLQRGSDKLGVNSTPTFFINGKKLSGDLSIADMEKEIQPHIKG
jgi:protein-disulfide isomerase